LVRYVPAALARMRLARQLSAAPHGDEEAEGMRDHVVICGFGRVGSAIGAALETFGVRYSVIEMDPDIVGGLRARGIATIFGDCSHSHVLERAGVREASLAIVTVADRDRARLAILNTRRLHRRMPIMARARRREDYEFLIRAGAAEVIQPETEASATFIRHACGHYLMVSDSQIRAYLRSFRDAMNLAHRRKSTAPAEAVPEVREITVSNPQFAGGSLREMKLRQKYGVTVVSIRRPSGESLVNPPADTVLQPNDRLRVLGLSDEIEAFAAQFAVSAQSSSTNS
jgi:CPA2 family monovalent cation:H+ antiporter-2